MLRCRPLSELIEHSKQVILACLMRLMRIRDGAGPSRSIDDAIALAVSDGLAYPSCASKWLRAGGHDHLAGPRRFLGETQSISYVAHWQRCDDGSFACQSLEPVAEIRVQELKPTLVEAG